MLRTFLLLFVLNGFLLISCKEKQNEKTDASHDSSKAINQSYQYLLDTSRSIIKWKGSSLAGSHNGILKFNNGILNTQDNFLKTSDIIVDMSTIKNVDLDDPSDRLDLENHLKSDDFFQVDSFPTSTFKITLVTNLKDSSYNAIVHGDLSIKNITRPLKVQAKVNITSNSISIQIPEFTVDRTQFNIMYQSKKLASVLKDQFISDDILLSIQIFANRK